MPVSSKAVFLLSVLLLVSFEAIAFLPSRNSHTVTHRLTKNRIQPHWLTSFVLPASSDDNSKVENLESVEDSQKTLGNVEGFLGYMAPYALAAVGSLLVTFLAFKFVFLDY